MALCAIVNAVAVVLPLGRRSSHLQLSAINKHFVVPFTLGKGESQEHLSDSPLH